MRRILTVLALVATLIGVVSRASAPVEAQPAGVPPHSTVLDPVVIASGAQYADVRGLAVDAAGNLYVSLEANPAPAQCVSRSSSSAFGDSMAGAKLSVTVFSNCAAVPGEDPSGIAVTPEGRVFLANRVQNRIRVLDMSTGKVGVIPAAAKNAAQTNTRNPSLFEPGGLAIDAAGNLYIADRGNYRVLALRPGASQFTYVAHVLDAAAVAADSARGEVYVVSPASNRIFEIATASGEVNAFAGTGAPPNSGAAPFPAPVCATSAALAAPEGVAVDGAGNVFIADTGANAILRVSGKSGMLSRVAGTLNLNSPGALAMDRRGDLFVADRGNHRIVEVAGIGASAATPAVTISPAQFNFGDEPTGGTTPTQAFTLANNSVNALSLSTTDFTFTGADVNDFAQTNNCVPQVAAGGACQISVTFTPAGTGARPATLNVADSDPSSPQTAQLSGTGDTFQITAASNAVTSQNVIPGKSATYNLQVAPDNTFSGTVTIACPLQLPNTTLTCATTPATLSITAGQASSFTVTLGTGGPNAKAFMLPATRGSPGGRMEWPLLATLAALIAMAIFSLRRRILERGARLERSLRSARVRASFALLVFAVVAVVAGAGCKHSSPPANPFETPPGIFTVNITASAQNASRAISLTLNVD